MKKISIVLFPKFQMLAYTLITEIIRIARRNNVMIEYQTITATNKPTKASNGITIVPDTTNWNDLKDSDIIILIASFDPLENIKPYIKTELDKFKDSDTIIAGIDTGAIILAHMGLLDNYEAVLHYQAESVFKETYPDIEIKDTIYVLDNNRLTCAGGFATADAILAWISRDINPELVMKISDDLVLGHIRNSDEPQRIKKTLDPLMDKMTSIMQQNLNPPLSIKQIAERLNITMKQLRRRCDLIYSQTPSTMYRKIRLEQAMFLLQNSAISITEISFIVGFQAPATFATTFKKEFNKSPRKIRNEMLNN